MPELSVVIPVFNEAQNIPRLLEAVRAVLQEHDYELILVNDGSDDLTAETILQHTDERTLLVDLDKNYGQAAAMRAGTEKSSGLYIAFLDGDLQNDPADIPAMLQLLKTSGTGMVTGNRKNRKDGFWLRRLPSYMANWLIRKTTGVHIKDYGCTLRILKRNYAEGLKLYGGLHRFIPVLATLQGAEMIQTDVRHHARVHGTSKYGLGRTFRVLKDLVLLSAIRRQPGRPRRIASPAGIICMLTGITALAALYINREGSAQFPMSFLYLPAIVLLVAGMVLTALHFFSSRMILAHRKKAAAIPYTIRRVYRADRPEPAMGL